MVKKHLIVFALLMSQLCVKAQVLIDSVIKPQKKTEIEIVYNHYLQDGNNSAVTGGIGTEKLTVYGPSFNIQRSKGSKILDVHLGADIISSASTDKIDYVISSASSRDARYIAEVGYQQPLSSKWSLQTGMAFSLESDYFSQGYKAGIKRAVDEFNNFSIQFQYFNDDLRWGRINPSYYRPERLIYPSELRYKEWFDSPKRNSYNLKGNWSSKINSSNVLGIYPEISYQNGLLSTPFHRVYFKDNSLRVENLPSQRYRAGLGLKLNTAVNSALILKNGINGYADDFGIRSISLENETVIRLNPFVMIMPGIRFLTQKGSGYFAPYQQHNIAAPYYTSDFDLSSFDTYTISMGLKWNPYKFIGRNVLFNTMILRYSYIYRSNGMKAQAISLIFQSEYFKHKK